MPAPLPHDAFARAVRAAFGAAARIVATEPLAGDASTRRYVRLRLTGGLDALQPRLRECLEELPRDHLYPRPQHSEVLCLLCGLQGTSQVVHHGQQLPHQTLVAEARGFVHLQLPLPPHDLHLLPLPQDLLFQQAVLAFQRRSPLARGSQVAL